MTIPPPDPENNFIRDLQLSSLLVTPERALMVSPFSGGVRSSKGFSRLGWFITMVDVITSDPAMAACRPDWTATQDLSLWATGWLREGPAVVDARLLRMGKRTITVQADIYDGLGFDDFEIFQARIDNTANEASLPKVARGLVTFVRIPGAAASGEGIEDYNPANWIGQLRLASREDFRPGVIEDWIGLQLIDAETGRVELPCVPYVANSIGTVSGGVQAVMIEAAAEVMRPGKVATDIQLNFLAQLKKGPVRTSCRVDRDAHDHSVMQVDIVDAGADDRLLTTATVTLQVPPTHNKNSGLSL